VRDIGTRFEVRRSPDDLRVRVRDGAISVDRNPTEPAVAARAGEEIALDSAGRIARQTIATDDPSWSWALAAAPPFTLEGAHLDEFLRWIERESGWRIEAEAELAATFADIELHGSIEGLSPNEAIEIVLPGSGLRYKVSAATLRISRN
jgi:ferric-dicitrate binding protein FerR (iron transport regulator)